MDERSALSTKRSKTSLARTSPQPSERAVVCPSLTTGETKLSVEVLILLSLLAGLCQGILSEDKLRLSIYAAKPIALSQGVTEADFYKYAEKFFRLADRIRRRNPIAQLFSS